MRPLKGLWPLLWVSQLSLLLKKPVSAPSLVIMCLESTDGSHAVFKEKWWALQPIDCKRSRVAPLLWRCKIHNGPAAQCGGTSFTLFLCHPFQGVGEHEKTSIPEEDRGVTWESSALKLCPNSCSQFNFTASHLTIRHLVFTLSEAVRITFDHSLAGFVVQYDFILKTYH